MNIINKLGENHIDIEVEAAVSLPIVNSEGEIVFVYYVKTDGHRDSYLLDKIKCIYQLQYDTDEIRTVSPEGFFPEALLKNVPGARIKPTMIGEEAVDREDDCFDMYNDLLRMIEQKGLEDDECKLFLKKYKDAVLSIFPVSVLKDLYIYAFDK